MSRLILSLAATAASLAFTAPVVAAGQPSMVQMSAASASIDAFYATRSNAPIWLKTPGDLSAATKLIALLKRAPLDGLSDGPARASQIEAALAKAQGGDAKAIAEADRLISGAWIAYVQALSAPTPGMFYDPSVPNRVPAGMTILRNAAFAPSLPAHLDSVSAVNPIYAALRDAAWTEAQLPGGGTSAMLTANLDRARAIPAKGRFVLVDSASQRLWMYDNGQPVDSMKVIVGMREFATPMIASTIWYATFNPYWHVPDHLVKKTIAPNVLKQGPGYLKTRGYEVIDQWSDDARIIPPSEIDWKAAAEGTLHIKVRQLPGAGNSMGKMKFNFANPEGIYLHDTPSKDLFAKTQRTLSNGCIRLEDAARLGRWLMGAEPRAPGTGPEQHVKLPQGVPVYVTYLTARPDAGGVQTVNDVYGRDLTSRRIAAVAPAAAGAN